MTEKLLLHRAMTAGRKKVLIFAQCKEKFKPEELAPRQQTFAIQKTIHPLNYSMWKQVRVLSEQSGEIRGVTLAESAHHLRALVLIIRIQSAFNNAPGVVWYKSIEVAPL